MKKICIVILLLGSVALLMANGLSLNSIGIKAFGMGGAFIGQADDLSALYWNPAGLANQNSGVSFYVGDIIPTGYYKADGTYFGYPAEAMDIDADIQKNHYLNPNIFLNHRINNLALSFGIYVPAGLGAEYDGDDLLALSNGVKQKWMNEIGVINFSPAIAYNFDKFQLGLAMNIMYGMFEIKRPSNILLDTDGDGIEDTPTSFQYEENSAGLGYGVTISGLFHFTEKLSLGTSFRTKSTVKMKGEAENDLMGLIGTSTKSDFDREVAWPTWLGAGLSYKANEKLTVNADIQYSAWSYSADKFVTEFDDAVWAAATAASGDDTFVLNWDDAIQYRIGLEYKVKPCIALRGGYYYDPAPAPDEYMNVLFPSSTNNVLTFGIGHTKNNLTFDLATEYLFGSERDIDANIENNEMTNIPGKYMLNVIALGFGITYRY
jgi:long-chain fatty acid transport protein